MTTQGHSELSSMGPYVLDAGIHGLQGLTELSPTEYSTIPKAFADEQIFNAPVLEFLGYEWRMTIGTRAGYIYKIFAEAAPPDREEAEAVFSEAHRYWVQKLGVPTEKSSWRLVWTAPFGNATLARREGSLAPYVSLSMTSRQGVRSNADQVTNVGRASLRKFRNAEFILRSGLNDSQLRQWLWLRATEWLNFPSFISQPIVPVLLIFFYWPWVLGGVFAADVLWAFVRYSYVNVRAASYAVNFVALSKWPFAIGSAVFLFVHHNTLAGVLAIAWPLLCGFIMVPGQIGKIEILFAKDIGYIGEVQES